MGTTTTLIAVAAALALCVFAGWRGARRWEPSQPVRMAPWRFIMLLSAAVVLMLLIHLAALHGAPMRPPV